MSESASWEIYREKSREKLGCFRRNGFAAAEESLVVCCFQRNVILDSLPGSVISVTKIFR